jgi:hypothetical protein
MKLTKYAALVKKRNICIVLHTEDGMFLGTGASIYKADGIPELVGEKQIAAVLEIGQKKLDKMIIKEEVYDSAAEVAGIDMSDDIAPGEMDADVIDAAVSLNGESIAAVKCEDGELLFFNRKYLAPLEDILKDEDESGYVYFKTRLSRHGLRYIVIKHGMYETLAAIMPTKVLSNEYMRALKEYVNDCERQWKQEQEKEEDDDNDGQMKMDF